MLYLFYIEKQEFLKSSLNFPAALKMPEAFASYNLY